MGNQALSRALICAVLGVVLVIGGPYAFAAVGAGWEAIVVLSLLLVCAGLLVAAFVLAMAAQICDENAVGNAEKLRLLADIFLIATVGVLFICTVFAFVLGVIGLAGA